MIKKDFDNVTISRINYALTGLTKQYIKAYGKVNLDYDRQRISQFLNNQLLYKYRSKFPGAMSDDVRVYLSAQVSKRFSQLARHGIIVKSGSKSFKRIVPLNQISNRLKFSAVKEPYEKNAKWFIKSKVNTSKNLMEDDGAPKSIEKIVLTIDESNDKTPNHKYVNLVEIAMLIKQAKDDYIKLSESLRDLAIRNNKHVDPEHITAMLKELIK